jgi:hypothetical protein
MSETMGAPHAAAPTCPPPPARKFGADRDVHGRFAPGNKGGPGNPYARQTAALRREVADFLGEGRMRPLALALYERALKGDNAAAKLLWSYGMGQVLATVHPDDLEAHELAVFRAATAKEVDSHSVSAYPAGMFNQFIERMRPIMGEAYSRQVQNGWQSVGAEHDAWRAAQAEYERQAAQAPPPGPARPMTPEEMRQALSRPPAFSLVGTPDGGPDGSRMDAHCGPAAVNKRPRTEPGGNGHEHAGPPERR